MGELGGEILTPGSDTTLGGGALQWPLPVAGTITSPQGYRTDPITGETSYHSGTDIAVPEGTPILAAADGTVTIANALDSWGGSYPRSGGSRHNGICDWITSKEITEKYLIGIRSEAYKKTQPNCKIENERKQKTSQVTAKLRGRERNRVPPTS